MGRLSDRSRYTNWAGSFEGFFAGEFFIQSQRVHREAVMERRVSIPSKGWHGEGWRLSDYWSNYRCSPVATTRSIRSRKGIYTFTTTTKTGSNRGVLKSGERLHERLNLLACGA
jgi:hypothetical protein